MRAHLLNWTIGPAFLGAMFGSFGCAPVPAPSLGEWLGILGWLGRLAIVFQAAGLVLTGLMAVVQRLIAGRFLWDEVQLFTVVMAVKMALLAFALAALVIVSTIAAVVLGGWQGGWLAAAGGAVVGAAVGLPAGLGVAWLKIPQRLGLDKPPQRQPGST